MIRNACAVCVLLGTMCASASANMVISIDSLTLQAGQAGDVNVWISSDALGGELLNSFGFEFRIATAGSTRLEFVDPQPDSQLTESNYVFSGNSGDANVPTPVGTVSTVVTPNDTFIGGDFTNDFSDVTVSSSPLLLATLRVTADTVLPPGDGDSFTVSLVDGLSTYFASNANPSLSYRSSSGTVTIQAAVVPEPSSLLIVASGGVFFLLVGARPWRRARSA